MTEVEKFAKHVEESGMIQCSGARFRSEWVDVRRRGEPTGLRYLKWPNATPESYCRDMAKMVGCTAEEYAAELNQITAAIERGEFEDMTFDDD